MAFGWVRGTGGIPGHKEGICGVAVEGASEMELRAVHGRQREEEVQRPGSEPRAQGTARWPCDWNRVSKRSVLGELRA